MTPALIFQFMVKRNKIINSNRTCGQSGRGIAELLVLFLLVGLVAIASLKIYRQANRCTGDDPSVDRADCPVVIAGEGEGPGPRPTPAPAPSAAPEVVEEFTNPQSHDVPLDHCLSFGANCDKPAANFFCRARGFESAKSFELGEKIYRSYIAGDEKFCNFEPPEKPYCRAFTKIVCRKDGE